MRTGISATDDAMARDIVAKNGYAKFLENKKLMMAWLAHVPAGVKPAGVKPADAPNDEWIPFHAPGRVDGIDGEMGSRCLHVCMFACQSATPRRSRCTFMYC